MLTGISSDQAVLCSGDRGSDPLAVRNLLRSLRNPCVSSGNLACPAIETTEIILN